MAEIFRYKPEHFVGPGVGKREPADQVYLVDPTGRILAKPRFASR